MSEAAVIMAGYERILAADFPHAGEIGDDETRVKAVTLRGCHGNTKNVLFLSFTVEDGCLRGLKYECQYCDVTMYITAELVCELVDGELVDGLGEIGDEEIAAALGGASKKIARQTRTALRLLAEALAAGLTQTTGDTAALPPR